MGLFERLFGANEPTRAWTADPDRALSLDLGRSALSGIALCSALGEFSWLGPAEDPKAAVRGALLYHSRGLEIDCAAGEATSFVLYFSNPRFQPWAGACAVDGQAVSLSAETTLDQFISFFGEPYWIDDDDEQILLFYEFSLVEWQVEFSANRTLNVLLITTPPLLADAYQRHAYGLDKPWPPET